MNSREIEHTPNLKLQQQQTCICVQFLHVCLLRNSKNTKCHRCVCLLFLCSARCSHVLKFQSNAVCVIKYDSSEEMSNYSEIFHNVNAGAFNTRPNRREIHFNEFRIVWHFRMHSHCMDLKTNDMRLKITSKIGICPRDAPWDMNKDPKFNVQIKSTDRKKWHLKFYWFAKSKNYLFQVFVNPFCECFLLNCISFVCYASTFTNPARYVAVVWHSVKWSSNREVCH